MHLSERKLRAALARIAEATSDAGGPESIGSVTLHAHQREAIARVEARLQRFGGVLLAEEVGRGKTFIALAVARRFRYPLVVLPASLRDPWQLAMRQAGVQCASVTHEALSSGRIPSITPDLVVVDESHRFRNPRTRRHQALVRLTARARVLLLSATPLQNSRADLVAQLSCFLGGAAELMSDAELADHLVRAAIGATTALPRVAPPEWVPLPCDDGAVLDAILSLPSPPRALEAGDAGMLRTLGLVRAWASSRAALRATLRRRLRTLAAMEQCVQDGRVPTIAELRSWVGPDADAVQLGFASLLVRTEAKNDLLDAMRDAVDAESAALAAVDAAVRSSADPDSARADALRTLRERHSGEKVIAFSELASTAAAMASAVMADGEVGLLTATRARIASGAISRRDLLARFAPLASVAPAPPERERVSLLVATDLLSEGVNLQDASVVVHLDLPWNPARLTQRMGRVRRPGGRAVVSGYLIAPPARAEHLLRVEQRLRRKLASAAAVVGSSFHVVPILSRAESFTSHTAAPGVSSAESRGEMLRLIARWRRVGSPPSRDAAHHARDHDDRSRLRPIVAGVHCRTRGWLAATRDGRIVAWVDGTAAADDCAPLAVRLTSEHQGRPRPVSSLEIRDAMQAVSAALARERVARVCGASVPSSPVRNAVAQHVTELLARTPRHLRARAASRAGVIRRACANPLPLGIERELALLTSSTPAGDPGMFLERAASLVLSAPASEAAAVPDDHLVAVILLGDAGAAQCAQ